MSKCLILHTPSSGADSIGHVPPSPGGRGGHVPYCCGCLLKWFLQRLFVVLSSDLQEFLILQVSHMLVVILISLCSLWLTAWWQQWQPFRLSSLLQSKHAQSPLGWSHSSSCQPPLNLYLPACSNILWCSGNQIP